MFYFCPGGADLAHRRAQAAGRDVAGLAPGRDGPGRRYWDPVEQARAAAAEPPADLAAVIEQSVTAHMVADVPVASFLSGGLDSSLVTAIAAARDPSIEAYTITFRAAGPAAGGDAGRRHVRPQDGGAPGDPAARDRDQPGRGRPAAADGRRAGRADRRPGGDQHRADVPGRPRRRGQGAAVRDGCRRAVRRVPQAPGLRAGCPLPLAAAGDPLRRGRAERAAAAGGGRRPRAAVQPLGPALPELRRAGGGGGVPAQLHALRPGRAGRPAGPDAVGPRRRRRGRPQRHVRGAGLRTTTSTGCA